MTATNETEFDPTVLPALAGRVGTQVEGRHHGTGRTIAIICGRFNGGVTTRLLDKCLEALAECGVSRHDVTVAWVPGAFEIPFAAKLYATGPKKVDAVITLGAVIRGDTGHYDVVAGECARGIQDVQLETGVPVVFGVLTTNTVEQALERSLPDETNKGRESALTALEMADLAASR